MVIKQSGWREGLHPTTLSQRALSFGLPLPRSLFSPLDVHAHLRNAVASAHTHLCVSTCDRVTHGFRKDSERRTSPDTTCRYLILDLSASRTARNESQLFIN